MMWDIAGSKNYRKVWHSYIPDSDLIIFMIDGSDFDKREDVKAALQEMLSNEKINEKVILFLVNKNVGRSYFKDNDKFNILPWNDMISNLTRQLTCTVFVQETSCLG